MIVAALVFASAIPLFAQQEESQDSYLFHFGPVALNPVIGVKDAGLDSNVNDTSQGQHDFTGALTTGLDGVLRYGVLRGTMNTSQGFVWFARSADQRSINSDLSGKLTAALGPIQPFVAGEQRRSSERIGYEIDTRAQRTEMHASGGVTLQITPLTAFVVSGDLKDIAFLAGETFQGVDLSRALNRREQTVSGELRLAVSPVSTLTFEGQAERDRFVVDSLRNTNSMRALGGVEFSPGGLLGGRAQVGYEQFNPTGAGQPQFKGAVAHATVGWSVFEGTKFELRADRDVEYSFEPAQPYYLTTGGSADISQHLFGPVALIASGGRHRQQYLATIGSSDPTRADIVDTYAAGFGYALNDRCRLAISSEHTSRRSSSVPSADYERTRILTTLDFRFTPK